LDDLGGLYDVVVVDIAMAARVPEDGIGAGVGEVMDEAVTVGDFEVQVDGRTRPILDVPPQAPDMDEDADDPEMAEYLARVQWIDARPGEQAIWEKGMFANQNVVAKLRQPFTLQRLTEHFNLGDA
jgi:hypothetical protein